jgi:hypothetical protein
VSRVTRAADDQLQHLDFAGDQDGKRHLEAAMLTKVCEVAEEDVVVTMNI